MESPGHTYAEPRIMRALSMPGRRPRLVLDRWRALLLVTLAYASATWGAGMLFRFVESMRGIDDARDEQVTLLFAAVMGVCWLISVPLVLRRR